MIELSEVDHRAGGAHILRDVSLEFQPGRLNVILGPNGAGKSTLVRIAAGLVRPGSGSVRYGGRSLGDITGDELARMRAVLSQHVELAFPLAAGEVAMMGRYPHYHSSPSGRDRQIVNQALELVGMVPRRHQPYPTLSAGEKQKVQLARVLAQIWDVGEPRRPRYLFLDEPVTSLDVHYQIQLLEVVRGLLGGDFTVVAVLHDLNLAFQYGHSFFVMEGGRLVHQADRSEDHSAELLGRVFKVKAHRTTDPGGGQPFWRFTL